MRRQKYLNMVFNVICQAMHLLLEFFVPSRNRHVLNLSPPHAERNLQGNGREEQGIQVIHWNGLLQHNHAPCNSEEPP